jgi:hypothetical protein
MPRSWRPLAGDIVMPLLGSDRSVEVTVRRYELYRPGRAQDRSGNRRVWCRPRRLAQQLCDKVPRTIVLGDRTDEIVRRAVRFEGQMHFLCKH